MSKMSKRQMVDNLEFGYGLEEHIDSLKDFIHDSFNKSEIRLLENVVISVSTKLDEGVSGTWTHNPDDNTATIEINRNEFYSAPQPDTIVHEIVHHLRYFDHSR